MTDVSRSSAAVVPINNGRDASGKFTTGNPGRVPGSRNRISNEALAAVRDLKGDALTILREKLIARDWDAAVFVLERCLPRGRMVELPSATPQEIANSLVNGEITTAEAKDIATALEKLANIAELDDLRQRLEEVERAVNAKK